MVKKLCSSAFRFSFLKNTLFFFLQFRKKSFYFSILAESTSKLILMDKYRFPGNISVLIPAQESLSLVFDKALKIKYIFTNCELNNKFRLPESGSSLLEYFSAESLENIWKLPSGKWHNNNFFTDKQSIPCLFSVVFSRNADDLTGNMTVVFHDKKDTVSENFLLSESRLQEVTTNYVNRIISDANKEISLEEIGFLDIFDLNEIQEIQDSFSYATGVASIITDANGDPITRPTNFCNLCNDVIRKTDKGRANCLHSDSIIGRKNLDGPIVQPCLSGGLWDAGASINIGDRHIGNWLIGQVLDENADIEKLVGYAREIGADETEYRQALGKVKRMPVAKFRSIAESLFVIANQLSAKAMLVVLQAKELSERKKVEDQLRLTQERLKIAVEGAGAVLWDWIIETRDFYIEESIADRLGYPLKTFFPFTIEKWKSITHPEDQLIAFQLFKNHVNGKAAELEVPFRLKDTDDVWHWFLAKGRISERRSDGYPLRVSGTLTDISEKKKIELESNEAHRMLRTLMGNLPGMAYRCKYDHDWTMLFVSKGADELTGYDAEDLLDNQKIAFNDLILPEYVEVIWALWEKAVSEHSIFNFEYEIRTSTGKIKWVWEQGCAIYNEHNEVVALEGFITDITDKRHAEQSLQDSEKRFRTLFEASEDANLIIENGCFIDFNPAALRLLGYSRSEVYGKTPFFLSPEFQPDGMKSEEKAALMIKQAKEKGFHRFEWVHLRKDRNEFWVEVMLTQITLSGKDLLYTTWRDITERKEAEIKLRELNERLTQLNIEYQQLNSEFADQNALLSESNLQILSINEELKLAKRKAEEADKLKSAFLANMSHEIRTPMNGILGFAELLQSPDLQYEEMISYIDIINGCSKQLLALINDIIDISKIEAGQLTITSGKVSGLNLLKEVYNMTSASVKSGVSYYSPQIESNKDHLFLADEIRLKQVLINLINNAIKFTDKGHIEFGYYAEDEFINFYVEDTGTGIAAEYHSLIFERFRQVGSAIAREKGGTGLGLAISKAIVNQMGGDIFVESEPGKGSKFQFKIPLILLQDSDRSIPQDLAEQVGTVLSWEGKTILIAEDEDANFTLLQLFLRNSGCEVLRAKNGREAVEMVNKYPTDVVLMDLKMPVMDGFEATVSIKRQFPNLPVIAQTAFALSNDRIKAVEAGCDNYLSKPISAKTLINTLARYLS